MMSMDTMTGEDLNKFRNKASLLSLPEQELIFYIIDSSDAIINGIMTSLDLLNPNFTRANQHAFGCNIAAGAIGSVCGFLAGALCSVATPVVGIIAGAAVSTVVGAAISTAAC